MIYIQFDEPQKEPESSNEGAVKFLLKKVFIGVMERIIPKANPDFEDKINDVAHWMLELDEETGIPQREIGMNNQKMVIMIMPYKNNYGYWTDNNFLLKDFKNHFNVSEISKESFEGSWNILDKSAI